jgi:diguanylate cyclase (GGDEF)-like protein
VLFRSYRARLVIYMAMLIVFLSATFIYSYTYIQRVMLDESDNHLVRLKQLLNGHLKSEQSQLERYATIVAQDLRIKEYMYVITGIGGSSKPLTKLYEREFGWLPIDRRIILSRSRQILVGQQHKDLAEAIQKYTDISSNTTFYYQGKTGLEMIAVTPIKYLDSTLGFVAVTRLLDRAWLEKHKRITEGEFFLIKNNRVLLTTLQNYRNIKFNLSKNNLVADSVAYRIYQIDLPGISSDKAELWFGSSENEIIAKLDKHRSTMLGLLGTGIIGVLVLGLLIIRNFSRPLKAITDITRQVVAGELPYLEKYKATNEFEELSNNFADMLKALREQQKEIEETHRSLEKSAITDSLTGFYNRRYMHEVFPKLYATAERGGQNLFAIILDLDYFKKINDSYGHIAGDQCLTSFSGILHQATRASDHLFRLGGEEFLILSLHNDIIEAAKFADKIRIIVEKTPVVYSNLIIKLTISGGISRMIHGTTAEHALKDLLTRADAALYDAKNSGRNRICIDQNDASYNINIAINRSK